MKTVTTPAVTTQGETLPRKKYKGHIVIPYTQELRESIKKICRKYGIQTHFKGTRTIKNILVKSKDEDPLDRVGPSTGISVGNSHVMRSTSEIHLGLLRRDIKST